MRVAPFQAAKEHAKTAIDEDKIFPSSQEIIPAGSIKKNQLTISYSLTTYSNKEKLIRLTLVFRNVSDRHKHIQPHITLIDSQGKDINAYTLKTFLDKWPVQGNLPSTHKTDLQHTESTPAEVADRYWIKSSYLIPPHGIAIGELVYHCKQLNFPMKLTVQIHKESYNFTAKQ